jgi:hypothetical protein
MSEQQPPYASPEHEKHAEQVKKIRYNLILKETELYFSKEKYNKNFDEAELANVKRLTGEVQALKEELQPIEVKLRQSQKLFYVEYEVETTNIWTGMLEREILKQSLWLNTKIDYDSKKEGLKSSDPNVKLLLMEIFEFLKLKYNRITILWIKSA